MKLIYLFIIIFFSPLISTAQSDNLSKKERKEERAKESEEKLRELYKILESEQFVVEAEQVFGDNGSTYSVLPNVNYFAIDSSYSVMQLSFDGLIGWNGIGGVTVEGKLDKYDLKDFKAGKPITLVGSINGRIGGNMQFTMYVYSSGMANVTVVGNWNHSITFQGRLFTLADSKVYKGIPLN